LTQSAKLKRNWTQAIVKPLYNRTLHWPLSNDVRGSLLIGSWIIVAGSKQIVCYNMHMRGGDGSIIYDASPSGIYAFTATGALYYGEQHSAYLIVQEVDDSKRCLPS